MPEHAREVAPGQLVDVWLDQVNFSRNPDFDFNFSGVRYTVDFDTDPTRVDPEGSIVELHVRLNWTLEDERITPFDLDLTVAGLFAWDEPAVEHDYLEGWLRFNGTYLLWPYARTHVANLTIASGMPPLHLETLQVPRPSIGSQETGEHLALPPDAR